MKVLFKGRAFIVREIFSGQSTSLRSGCATLPSLHLPSFIALGIVVTRVRRTQWEVMKMFEEELERVGATRPSSVERAEEITNVYKLLSEVCPFHFLMERWIERQSEEKLPEHIKKQWNIIDKG
jgi:hypothetical protein